MPWPGAATRCWTGCRATTPWPAIRRHGSDVGRPTCIMPEEAELAGIRRSSETGLPYGECAWVDRLCRQLKLDLTIRPRGRPRKDAKARK